MNHSIKLIQSNSIPPPVFPHFPGVRRPDDVRLAHRSLTTEENAIGKTEKFAVIRGLFSNTRTISYNIREEHLRDAAE